MPNTQIPDVRNSIAYIIQDRTYKQSTIAQRAGMTPDQFCAVLKHRRRLDTNEFLEVCTALGMTPDDVARYQGEASR